MIIDSGSNCVLIGKMLKERRPHLIPYAAHCMDLIHEDIWNLPLKKKTNLRGVSRWIYL